MQFKIAFLASILLLLLMLSCVEKKSGQRTPTAQKNATIIDSVNIFHAALPVKVPVKGFLEYWKKETIFTSDSTQVITVLVEEDQPVQYHQLLLSLWQLDKSKEFTPVDVRAPFDGIVEQIFVKVGSRKSPQTPLLHIYNDDFFSMRIKMHPDQIKFIRKNQKVVNADSSYEFDGYVESVDKRSNFITILLKNQDYNKSQLNMVNLDIFCGKVNGDFILRDKFNNNKIIAYIDDESSFEIVPIAVSDSLSLISPAIPHLSRLSVLSHKY
jgi:hypothetical protein